MESEDAKKSPLKYDIFYVEKTISKLHFRIIVMVSVIIFVLRKL